MRGTTHAVIGASAPVGLVATGGASLIQGALMAAVAAGAALLPDLDTPRALASQAFGRPAHRAVHALSGAALRATATGRDRGAVAWQRRQGRDPVHRSLTHTLVAALAVGCAVYLVARLGTPGVAALSGLAVFTLWPVRRRAAALVVAAAFGVGAGAALLLTPILLALAVGVGYLSHLVADACTADGVPALWPLPVRDRRWWRIRLLGSLVRSGSATERAPAVGVSLASNGLLLILPF